MLEFGKKIKATWNILHPDYKGLPFEAEFVTDDNNRFYLNSNCDALSNPELYNFLTSNTDRLFTAIGKTEDNKIITLEDAFLGRNNYQPEDWKFSLHANYALLGEKQESTRNIQINKIIVIFDSEERGSLNKTIDIMDFEIKNKTTAISYKFSSSETFENAMDEIINIQYLYSFLLGKMLPIKSVLIENENNEKYSALIQFTKINQRNMKITPIMEITPEKFVELYSKWKNTLLIDTFPIDLYFTTLANSKNLYEQFYLDYLIRSFEGMHKIKHLEKITLRNRFKSLFSETEIINFVEKTFNQNEPVLDRLIDFRNLYAHCKHSANEKKIPEGEYYKYSILLFNIIRVFIAKELLNIRKTIPMEEI